MVFHVDDIVNVWTGGRCSSVDRARDSWLGARGLIAAPALYWLGRCQYNMTGLD